MPRMPKVRPSQKAITHKKLVVPFGGPAGQQNMRVWAQGAKRMTVLSKVAQYGTAAKDIREYHPIDEQVRNYLVRLRHSLPFPGSPASVYFECMPDFIRDWVERGYFEQTEAPDVRTQNVVRMLKARTPILLRGGNPPVMASKSRAIIQLHNGAVFWVELPFETAVPLNSVANPLLYPDYGQRRPDLIRWIIDTSKMDHEIDFYFRKVREISPLLSSANILRKVFPELSNFVSFVNDHTPPMDREQAAKVTAAVRNAFEGGQREKLITNLATAVMLPDAPLTAWSGYPT